MHNVVQHSGSAVGRDGGKQKNAPAAALAGCGSIQPPYHPAYILLAPPPRLAGMAAKASSGSSQPPHHDVAALTAEEEARVAATLAQPFGNQAEADQWTSDITKELERLIPSLQTGIAAGPTGLRYEHLRYAASTPDGLRAVVVVCLRAAVGWWSVAALPTARLTTLRKAWWLQGFSI